MSLVKNESVEVNKSELEVLIDAKTFQDACRKAYLKQVKRINISGFRKGKAPKKIIEKKYGSDVFFDAAIELVCPTAVDEAVKEAGIDVVGFEKIEPIEVSEQAGCRLKVVCVLKPEVEIANYKGIEIKSKVLHVTDEIVEKELNRLRERNGRLISVTDRAAQNGDTVTLDYEGFVNGKKFEGGSAKNQNLKLGSGQFIEGFEKQVEGHSIGDSFDVNVTFPNDYGVEALKGKPAKFSCVLHEIKFLELSKLDDEFAKDVSKFDTLSELKNDIRQSVEKRFQSQADDHIVSEIMSFLYKNVVVDIPKLMVDNLTDDLAKSFENDLASRGLTLENYLQTSHISGYDLKNLFSTRAEYQLKTELALGKIAEIEKIEVSDADFDEERQKIAQQYGVEVEQIRNLNIFSNERLKPGLIRNKTIDFIKNSANISIVEEKSEPEKQKNVEEESESEKQKGAAKNSANKSEKSATSSNIDKTKKATASGVKSPKKVSSAKAEPTKKSESATDKSKKAAAKVSSKPTKSVSKNAATAKTTKVSKASSGKSQKKQV